jgi:adenylylsulfate kinase
MSWAIWITGLPASGKSALARAVVETLRAEGEPVVRLELDAMRRIVTPSPTYSDAERAVVYRALVWVAVALTGAGVPVVIDATAHRREWRDLARASIRDFAEVQVQCPLSVCREREARRREGNAPRAIYARAGLPGATVPGVDVPYEPALAPELTVDTERTPVAEGAGRIVALARTLARTPRPAAAAMPARWAVWITGLPGSGKSTLAARAAQALHAAGVEVRVLALDDARRFVLDGRRPAGREEEILHRTLVYAAKRLTEAGVPVIIDATAPRRRWRELARELIGHFAEVQLLCPRHVCARRERAARWGLTGDNGRTARPGHARGEGPDITLEYEASLQPQLVIHTDIEDPSTAAGSVVLLARGLHAITAQREEPTWLTTKR